MTDAEHDRWQSYLRLLADMLGLKDWDVRVKRDKPDPSCGADCLIWYAQKRASIRLNNEPFALTGDDAREDQRRMAIHELIHCHVEYADEAVRLAFKDSGDPRDALFQEYYKRASEMTVECIATAIAPLLPLPETPDA